MVLARTFFNLEKALLSFCPFYRAAFFQLDSCTDQPMAKWFDTVDDFYIELTLD